MSSIFTPFKLPTTITPNATPSADWQDPSNILLVDNLFAVASGPANILEVGTFNLNVPVGATMLGITLQVKGYRGAAPVNLSIYAIDDITGVSYAYPLSPDFSGFNSTNTLYTIAATLFGTTWSSNQINNIKFRLIADGELHMDAILARAEYVPAVVPPPDPVPAAGIVVDEFVEAQPFNFANALSDSDVYLFLENFNYPDGTEIQYVDFHTSTEAYIVLDQGIPGKEEVGRFINVEQDYGGSGLCRLTFGTLANRGLNFQWPYDSVSSLIVSHDSTAKAVLANPAVFYRRFLRINQIGALVSAPIEVLEEGVQVLKPTTKFNFKGHGQSTTVNVSDPEMVDVQIDGNSAIPPNIVNVGSATSGSVQVSTLQFSLTSEGIDRGGLCQIGTQQSVTISSVTYNGVSLSQEIIQTDIAHGLRTEQWFLLAPPLGTHNIVITLSAPAYISAGAVALQSVNQSTPVGTTASGSGTSTTPSVLNITSADYSLVFDSLCTAPGVPSTWIPGAGQGLLWDFVAGADLRQAGSSYLPSGTAPDSVTNQYVINPSTDWVMTSVEILGIAPVPPTADDHKVKATTADTVPGFLDPKMTMVSGDASVTIVKTILNPGANEVVKYDFRVSGGGGGGGGGSPTFIDQTPNDGTYGTLAGVVDGANLTFTVSQALYATSKLAVYLNGLIQLQGASDDWHELVPASGTFRFSVAPLAGDIVTAVYQTTATTPGGSPFSINQTAHGFIVGDIIRPTTAQWIRSRANVAANAEAWAQVTVRIDADNFTATPLVGVRQQQANIVSLIAGFTGGDPLYLSSATPGLFTNVAPSTAGTVTKPIGYVEADSGGVPISLLTVNYRGQVNQSTPVAFSTLSSTIPAIRVSSAVSGVVNYAHGLPNAPAIVRIRGGTVLTGTDMRGYSDGLFNSSGNNCFSFDTALITLTPHSGQIIHFEDINGGNSQTAVCTVDSTNVILTWTKTGTGGQAGTSNFIIEAQL